MRIDLEEDDRAFRAAMALTEETPLEADLRAVVAARAAHSRVAHLELDHPRRLQAKDHLLRAITAIERHWVEIHRELHQVRTPRRRRSQ